MKYVALDLEMCRVPKGEKREKFNSSQELIQIGAVEVDENFKPTRTFMSFVKPEYGELTPFIENLTGIKAADLVDAPLARDALKSFAEWLDEDDVLVTWSDSDTIQIDDELYYKEIDLPELYDYLDNYVDCQYLFGQMFKTDKQYNLKEALTIANIEYDKGIHDALVDAKNTILLFEKLENSDRQSFSPYYMTQDEASSYIFNSFSKK